MNEEKQAKEQYKAEEELDITIEQPSASQESAPETEGAELSAEETQAAVLREQEDKYLRLLAEYDNFRKRSQRERETAWATAKAETAAAFLPVFDNLTRALQQETADEAYAKGVQMTMTQLKTILDKLGIEEIPALGEPFNPALHNAVMHVEDENLGANVVSEVFEAGFRSSDKVIRFAMVKVAN